MARGVITDALQKSLGYPENGWTQALTRSRMSRGLYGGVKMLTFMASRVRRFSKISLSWNKEV